MRARADRKPKAPLDREALERLALFYAGRYGTTQAKLARYLTRKLGERGWSGGGEPPVEALVERFAALGYVDDEAFASARTASMLRRGYGERRVAEALRAAGVGDRETAAARLQAADDAIEAARRFARRRRLGPYAPARPDAAAERKAIAAMLRAGHRLDVVRTVLGSLPDEAFDGPVP